VHGPIAGANDMPMQLGSVIHNLRRTVLAPAGASDGRLLERFVAVRDEAAFEALLRRHGPMVFGVCRRILGNSHDADDAFQATFLVLVRRGNAVKPRDMVGAWLHGVAYRTALEARTKRARRQARETQVTEMAAVCVDAEAVWQEMKLLLDREVQRLPDKYRAAVVLCDLEGRPRKEVARQLNVPEGTLSSRLATARRMLGRRLTRSGAAIPAGCLAAVVSAKAAAPPPSALFVATAKAAVLSATDPTAAAAVISHDVTALTKGVMRTMFLSKLKPALLPLLTVGLLASGAAGLAPWSTAAAPADSPGAESKAAPPALQSAWADLDSAEEAKAARAVLALGASPKDAVAFLKANLHAVKADPKLVARWIAQLDDDDFTTREAAQRELEYQGKYVKEDLKKARAGNVGAEAKKRLQTLLDGMGDGEISAAPNSYAPPGLFPRDKVGVAPPAAVEVGRAPNAGNEDDTRALPGAPPNHALPRGRENGEKPIPAPAADATPRAEKPETTPAGGDKTPVPVPPENGAPKGGLAPPPAATGAAPAPAPAANDKLPPPAVGATPAAPADPKAKDAPLPATPAANAQRLAPADPNPAPAAQPPPVAPAPPLALPQWQHAQAGAGAKLAWTTQPGQPKGISAPGGPPRSWVRAARAVGILEHINSPEARQVLEELAQGEADALPTIEAKAALERLDKK
jgi:RNA polymerase sigma factor (sigma-70 family)